MWWKNKNSNVQQYKNVFNNNKFFSFYFKKFVGPPPKVATKNDDELVFAKIVENYSPRPIL